MNYNVYNINIYIVTNGLRFSFPKKFVLGTHINITNYFFVMYHLVSTFVPAISIQFTNWIKCQLIFQKNIIFIQPVCSQTLYRHHCSILMCVCECVKPLGLLQFEASNCSFFELYF